ncbi:tetratricopeptide repeat protein [Aquimarina algicola]|uniref:Tetratricopeptide repeat protein n=1 Tax=Aquimarina algicola TaxID=2589995 RepID=A0A504JJV7_9FLAO|nr:tetratricopeptide repeat protein [Aquimarina algicola]TPN86791.1 tetratricopeptide repeat protein [Aquimarina algicola]
MSNKKTEKELLEKAEKIYHQYNEDRYPKAIELFKELLQQYPENIKGWAMLSTMQSANKDFDDALVSIDKAIQLDPKNIRITKQKSLLFSELNRLLYDGSKYFDERSDGFYEINTFKNKNEILEAYIRHLYTQIDNFPEQEDIHEVYEDIGTFLSNLGEYNDSIKVLKKAIEILDNSDEDFEDDLFNPYATINLSISKSYEKIGELDNALIFLDKAIEKDSENSYLLTHKAKLYDKKGDKKSKAEVYTMFLENTEIQYNKTKDIVYLFHKIEAYIDLQNVDKASFELSRIEKSEKSKNYLDTISEYKIKIENLKAG